MLGDALADPDPRIREGACRALGNLGPVARPLSQRLLNALSDPVPSVRYGAAYALPKLDPKLEQPVAVLIEALAASDWLIRIKACSALNLLPANVKSAVPALLQLAGNDSNLAVRMCAAKALGNIHTLEASQVQRLAASLADREPLNRKAVADALGELAPEATGAIAALAPVLHDNTNYVRGAAANALARFREAALPALREALKDQDIYTRQSAIEALGRMKPLPSAAVPILISASGDRNIDVSDGAAGALMQAGIRGEWLTRCRALEEERKLEDKHRSDASRVKQLYTKEKIIASIPPDENHKFPLRLESLPPFTGINLIPLLVGLLRGKDRMDRVTVWRQEGDRYRLLKSLDGPEPPDVCMFDAINVFHHQGYPFLHVRLLYSGTGGFAEENVFALNRDNSLEPVKMNTEAKIELRPGEGVWKGTMNRFSDSRLSFEYYIWNEGDANCCPTAGRVTGTYKLTKETRFDEARGFHDEWTMSVDKAAREPIGKH